MLKKVKEEGKDIFGKDVEIGDYAAFNPPRYKGLVIGRVIKINKSSFRLKYNNEECTRNEIVVLNRSENLEYYL